MSSSSSPRHSAVIRRSAAAVGVLCTAAVAAALGAQYMADMQPCPWCILQRLIFVLIGLIAWAIMLWPRRSMALAGAILTLPLAAAGIASAAYQNLVAAKTASCDLSLAERLLSSLKLDHWLPSVFEIRASCADAATTLLGLPMEAWSGMLYALVAMIAAHCARQVLRA